MNAVLISFDTSRREKPCMPIGIGYVKAYLKRVDHEIEVMAFETFHYDLDSIFKRIYGSSANVSGI